LGYNVLTHGGLQVPQIADNVSLASLPESYNYNSGVPNSPPPSFRSSQSVSNEPPAFTPPITAETNNVDLLGNPRLWSGSVAGSASGSEALVLNLHRRIERLEESVGRLLLEKTERSAAGQHERSNCCVMLDADDILAKDMAASGSNCCVTVKKHPKHD